MAIKNIVGTLVELPNAKKVAALIDTWSAKARALGLIKAEEMELRKEVINATFKATEKGTAHFALGHAARLTATTPVSYKVDSPAFLASWQYILDNKIPLDKLVRIKVEVVDAEYNKLTKEQQLVLADFVTISQGTPSLKLNSPER